MQTNIVLLVLQSIAQKLNYGWSNLSLYEPPTFLASSWSFLICSWVFVPLSFRSALIYTIISNHAQYCHSHGFMGLDIIMAHVQHSHCQMQAHPPSVPCPPSASASVPASSSRLPLSDLRCLFHVSMTLVAITLCVTVQLMHIVEALC
jgi:hypothetical protein